MKIYKFNDLHFYKPNLIKIIGPGSVVKEELAQKIYADFTNHLSAVDAKEIEILARAKNIPVNILHQFLIQFYNPLQLLQV